jgi:endonuclease III
MTQNFLFLLSMTLAFFISPMASAQSEQPISDEEMQQFADAIGGLQTINAVSQQEMIEVLQTKGMQVQRFNEIQMSLQNPEVDIELSDEEAALFEDVASKIQEMQIKAQEEMEKVIEKVGLSFQRYEQLLGLIQSNPEELERLQNLLGG